MIGFGQASLKEMMQIRGELVMKEELSRFSCPLNEDVEYFIRHKAIEFTKQGIAATHLIYRSYKGAPVLVGYYALANKTISVKASSLNSKWRSRINRFATHDPELKRYEMAIPLIGQLGKNYSQGYDSLITGDQLLQFACDKVHQLQVSLGGKMVYLECEDNPKLVEFYERNGFYKFSSRNLDGDEIGHDKIRYLLQMIKYFKD